MRMRRTAIGIGTVGVIAALAAVVGARGGGGTAGAPPEFDLSWHTIDGGGVMRSTGGDFERYTPTSPSSSPAKATPRVRDRPSVALARPGEPAGRTSTSRSERTASP